MMTNVLPKEEGGKNLSKLFYREMQVALSSCTDPFLSQPPGSLSFLSLGKNSFKIPILI
jgi:hypothetical protein